MFKLIQDSLYRTRTISTEKNYNNIESLRLLINNPSKHENVLNEILQGLTICKSFMFIVAFVTESGLATLKTTLLDLKRKGIRGKLLTSTYLNFNNPKIFREMLKIENLEVRLSDLEGFHSKGYIFNGQEDDILIIGSTNLTASALKVNYEWNVKIRLIPTDYFISQIRNQFEHVWSSSVPLTNDWVLSYEISYVKYAAQKIILDELAFVHSNKKFEKALLKPILPNKMQVDALKNIISLRNQGKQKGLVISATGTGKTFLAAFDVKNFMPERFLFVSHREQILFKSKSDFIRVLGNDESEYGFLSGPNKDLLKKYTFSTIQTLSKSDIMSQFEKDAFDYILIDEVHRAGANSYRKITDYFTPKFLLGMTATPERTDDFNIFELFDYNIAYEIRLQAALEEDLLCPFNYYGVTDYDFNGELVNDSTKFKNLVKTERVNHIIEKIEYYGYSGTRVQGLMFVSRKEEAEELSRLFNYRGYRTVALSGDDSIEKRQLKIKELEDGELHYIITVDIFNEGIDIPSLNQVILLRQTQSSIIFIQQLGRGLRKHDSKEFVTIIDFIGNYKNNYLIPIALSGDKSLNKDVIRRQMKEMNYVHGLSTINFEEVAKKLIYESIKSNNLSEWNKMSQEFHLLKNRLGKSPFSYDFILNNSIDPTIIINKFDNYHNFLERLNENSTQLTDSEYKILTMISQEVMNGKRRHELILLELLIHEGVINDDYFYFQLQAENCKIDSSTITSVQKVMDLSFFTQSYQKKYGGRPVCVFESNGTIQLNNIFYKSLNDHGYFKELVIDVLRTARIKCQTYQPNENLTLYQKYTRKEVCKNLNWVHDESSTIYGYKTKHQTCPIFVTYHKHVDVDSSINYDDELMNRTTLKWYTRSNRSLKSEEVLKIVNAKKNQIDIHIFIKKDDDDGRDFYYLGKAEPLLDTIHETTMKGDDNKDLPVVCMQMNLMSEIELKLFEYITSN